MVRSVANGFSRRFFHGSRTIYFPCDNGSGTQTVKKITGSGLDRRGFIATVSEAVVIPVFYDFGFVYQ